MKNREYKKSYMGELQRGERECRRQKFSEVK